MLKALYRLHVAYTLNASLTDTWHKIINIHSPIRTRLPLMNEYVVVPGHIYCCNTVMLTDYCVVVQVLLHRRFNKAEQDLAQYLNSIRSTFFV